MSNYDEKEALRDALKNGFPASMRAALTDTYPRTSIVGLSQGNGAVLAPDINQVVPVAASGAQEEAPLVVNLGRDGTKHDFEAAAPALPHAGTPVASGNCTAETTHADDCRYWKSGDFCTCGATE